MQQTNEIKLSLKREYDLYSNAMAFYKKLYYATCGTVTENNLSIISKGYDLVI